MAEGQAQKIGGCYVNLPWNQRSWQTDTVSTRIRKNSQLRTPLKRTILRSPLNRKYVTQQRCVSYEEEFVTPQWQRPSLHVNWISSYPCSTQYCSTRSHANNTALTGRIQPHSQAGVVYDCGVKITFYIMVSLYFTDWGRVKRIIRQVTRSLPKGPKSPPNVYFEGILQQLASLNIIQLYPPRNGKCSLFNENNLENKYNVKLPTCCKSRYA